MTDAAAECRELIERVDWAATPLGPRDQWSELLRSWLQTLLGSPQPMLLLWGPSLIQFYNDAFAPSFGEAISATPMGQRAQECWREAWPVFGPQVLRVMESGEPTLQEETLARNFRNGRLEDVFWTYSYSPVFEADGTIAATLVVCTETTRGVLARRRLSTTARVTSAMSLAETPSNVLERVLASFSMVSEDIPWVIKLDAEFALEEVLGVSQALAQRMKVDPLRASEAEGSLHELEALGPAEAWPDATDRAFAVPLDGHGSIVFGVSTWLPFDDTYRDHLLQIAKAIGNALRRASAQQGRSELIAKLKLANRAKDEFFALLGHELRNPLAPIVTALESLRLQGGTSQPPHYEMIERQVAHLVRLVDDLLDIAGLTRGKIKLRKSTCDLASVIDQALEEVDSLRSDRKHHVEVDVRGPLSLWGDATRLIQVVANLLTNAIRYTAPGGTIRVHARRDRDEIVLEVSDNGRGIEPDALSSIFEIFSQGAQEKHRPEGGLGLGLALVKNLVELHRGSASASSPGPGQGSTFTIRLPARTRPTSETPRVEPSSTKPLRIMVVDDNDDAAEMLAILLRLREHTVETAHDGPSAIALFDRYQPRVVLLDIGLPGMDGYEVLEQLKTRARAIGHEFSAFAITGFGQESDRARSLSSGFTAHLVKPVNLDVLEAALASCEPGLARGGLEPVS